jgi:Leucine-rich repeat (LRR) protein
MPQALILVIILYGCNIMKYKLSKYLSIESFHNSVFLYVNGIKFVPYGYRSILNDEIIGDNEDISNYVLDVSDNNTSVENKFVQCYKVLKLWIENDYNSHLFHFSLSFPLLKALYELSDPIANKVYKEEILNALTENQSQVCRFLIEEDYLNVLSKEEIESSVSLFNITKLELTSKGYIDFPKFLLSNAFSMLEELDLTNNSISKIPDDIDKLDSLKSLDLSENQFVHFPSILSNLPNLKELYFRRNRLTDLLDFKKYSFSLEKLDLSSNLLTEITPSIIEIQTLKALDLECNSLKEIPSFLGELSSLETLILSSNKIYSIPQSISKLDSLKVFEVEDGHLDSYSKVILYEVKLKAARNEAKEIILKLRPLLDNNILTNAQRNRLEERIKLLEDSLKTNDLNLININIDKITFIN